MIKHCKDCGGYVDAEHSCLTPGRLDCKHEWLIPSNLRTVCKLCGRDGWISLDTQSGHEKTQSGSCIADVYTEQESPSQVLRTKMVEALKQKSNDPAYCGYCRCITETKGWDCKDCGWSKQHPDLDTEAETSPSNLQTESVSGKDWKEDAIKRLTESNVRLEEMLKKTSLENEELRIAHRDVVSTCARLAAENDRLLAIVERSRENAEALPLD